MKNINTFALGLTCTFTNAHVHVGISSERGQIGLGSNLVDLVIEILDEDVAAGRPIVDKFSLFLQRSRHPRANAARLAVRSSLMKILLCGCSELWYFSLKRDRYTASRSFSLLKRTIITRSRLVLPSFVTFGPRRWLRSRWSGDIGGCSCIDSLITVVINESVSSSDAVEASGMPKNLKFGRREYCSTASEASSRRSILASSFLIVSFLLSTSRVKVSTLLVSVLMESIRFLGNKISLSRFSRLSSFNSSITHNANVSLSTTVCWPDVSLAVSLAGSLAGFR